MYSTHLLNNINGSQATENIAYTGNQAWLKLANVESQTDLSNTYADICQQHKLEKKWVLFINPEESTLEQLSQKHGVDISKILCVSFKGKNKVNNLVGDKSAHLDIKQLKSVLSRGNCSAVILSNASFTDTEIDSLDRSARSGETQCVILKHQTHVH